MRKRTVVRIITFLTAGLVAVSAAALMTARRARSLELYSRAATQRAFDELVNSVSELSNSLEKSQYVTDPALEGALCTQIFGRAVAAQMAMGELPYSSQELEQMSSFLSRVGDYACTLSRTVGGAGGCTEEELSNLTELASAASVMSLNLQDMQARMMSGRLTMGEVYGETRDAAQAASGEGEAPLAGTVFQSIEAEFPELPTLIYDGPFSESMTSPEPVFLQGLPEVDERTALEAAAAFLEAEPEELVAQGECAGAIPCRSFVCERGGGEYTVSVTKQGGVVMSALCSRVPGSPRLPVEAGLAAARSFLERQGYEDMAESYHMVQGGVLTVNFEYEQDGVLCYPDLIKVGVALDTGAVVSYDAKGYLSAHRERTLAEAQVTAQEARGTVSPRLAVRSERMAVIPSEGGQERLCYEYVCRARDDGRYILYVNAETGAQERILILLEDDSGTLTV